MPFIQTNCQRITQLLVSRSVVVSGFGLALSLLREQAIVLAVSCPSPTGPPRHSHTPQAFTEFDGRSSCFLRHAEGISTCRQ